MSEHNSDGSDLAEAIKPPRPDWFARFRRVLTGVFTWQGAGAAIKACLVGASRVGWIVLGVSILALFAQSVITEVVNVDSISVPKRFAESGYTSDVASQRLRDALTRFAKQTGSSMQSPHLALTSELPKITVPKVDISLDTATTLARNLLHLGNVRNISGEFIVEEHAVGLRLRIDGQEIFTGTTPGSDLATLDGLFDAAAPSVIREIRPYLIASATYKDDPERALQMAESIIVRLPRSDINVQWSYVLEGKYYLDQHKPVLAESRLRQAVQINSKNAAAHYSLAIALEKEGRNPDAIAEYRQAIRIDPSSALAHNNLGGALRKQKDLDAALAEYRLAVAWDPLYAPAYNNFGAMLGEQGQAQEAIAAYRRAIEIDPMYSPAHYNLGVILGSQGNREEAVAEFRRAVQNNPNDVRSHIGLANTLLELRRTDEALKEYEIVMAIDSSNEVARRNIESLRLHPVANTNQEDINP